MVVGHNDVEAAIGSSSSDGETALTGVFGSLLEGDLVNKAVILLQYLQMLSIFLTPDFYVSLPLIWLKSFSWVSFVNLDVNIFAVGVDLEWVSFLCSLCYQPIILFWWWCVDFGYVEARMFENTEWFSARWFTSNAVVQEKLAWLDIDIENLDEVENLKSFTLFSLVIQS